MVYNDLNTLRGYFIMKRNIVVAVLLSFITCGIYNIIWMIKLNDELNALANKQGATSGGMVILLMIITCGIYGWIWYYKMGENVDAIKSSRGEASSNTPIIYLIIALFGLAIVNDCLMQDTINKSVEG